ncbi:MAG: hypothetical protein ACREJ3_17970, partial [Polyangiaceae bacterium]
MPASYANVDMLVNSAPQPSFTLDKDGCFDVTSQYFDANGDPSASRSTWQIVLNSTFQRPDGVVWNVAAVPDPYRTVSANGTVSDAGVQDKRNHAIFGKYAVSGAGCEDVEPGGTLLAVPVDPPATDVQNRDIMNVAAVTSRILNTPDLAISPKTPYWSFAGDVCLGPNAQEVAAGDSCYFPGSTDALFVGTGPAPGQCPANHMCPPDSYWKYVVAHETGHMVQAHAIKSFSGSYQIPPPAPALCQCKQVGTSNQLHCLQSVDDNATAQKEGFAQFFSARVWNDPASPSCTFVDYKDFLRPDSVPCPAGRTCIEGPVATMPDGGIPVTIPAGFHAEAPPIGI